MQSPIMSRLTRNARSKGGKCPPVVEFLRFVPKLAQAVYKGLNGRMLDNTVALLSPGERGQPRVQHVFLYRGNSTTTDVEGFFTPDGVIVGHMLLLTAECPAVIVVGTVVLMFIPSLCKHSFVSFQSPANQQCICHPDRQWFENSRKFV